jgi:hypothetical protein
METRTEALTFILQSLTRSGYWNYSFSKEEDLLLPVAIHFDMTDDTDLSDVLVTWAVGGQRLLEFTGRFMQRFYPSDSPTSLRFPYRAFLDDPTENGRLHWHEVQLLLYRVPATVRSVHVQYECSPCSEPHSLTTSWPRPSVHTPFRVLKDNCSLSADIPTTEWRIPLCHDLFLFGVVVSDPVESAAWARDPATPLSIHTDWAAVPQHIAIGSARVAPEGMPWRDWFQRQDVLVVRTAEPVTTLHVWIATWEWYWYDRGMMWIERSYQSPSASQLPVPCLSTPDRPLQRQRAAPCVSEAWCAITLQSIEDEEYQQCDVCRGRFVHSALQTWLRVQSSCPLCRSPWTSPVVFVPDGCRV